MFGTSERRACSVIGADRKSMRYRSCRADDTELRLCLRELAQQRRRFGYRWEQSFSFGLLAAFESDGSLFHYPCHSVIIVSRPKLPFVWKTRSFLVDRISVHAGGARAGQPAEHGDEGRSVVVT
jgi:hypothetical protein